MDVPLNIEKEIIPPSQPAQGETEHANSFPTWVWGVAAGGAAILATVVISSYHVVSKKLRRDKAVQQTKDQGLANFLGDVTPRQETTPRTEHPSDQLILDPTQDLDAKEPNAKET